MAKKKDIITATETLKLIEGPLGEVDHLAQQIIQACHDVRLKGGELESYHRLIGRFAAVARSCADAAVMVNSAHEQAIMQEKLETLRKSCKGE